MGISCECFFLNRGPVSVASRCNTRWHLGLCMRVFWYLPLMGTSTSLGGITLMPILHVLLVHYVCLESRRRNAAFALFYVQTWYFAALNVRSRCSANVIQEQLGIREKDCS